MASRFAQMYKRDCSVEMMRLKMTRRRSQAQKENREKMLNVRRNLDQLTEVELSLETSCSLSSQEMAPKVKAANDASLQRKMQLARYKENKELRKEKEKREREKKGVFKTGLYKPDPLWFLPASTAPPVKGKTTESKACTTRVTRSMVQSQKQPAVIKQRVEKKVESTVTKASEKKEVKPLTSSRNRAVESSGRAPVTRSANKTVIKAVSGNTKTITERKPADKTSATCSEAEEPKAAPSFAPEGFEFHPPVGLKHFELEPVSPPRFASVRVKSVFPSPPKLVLPAPSLSPLSRSLTNNPPIEAVSPPAPSSSALESAQPSAPAEPSLTSEPQHDVAYFRAEMASETERLTGLSELWESRFEDSAVPEEMRDRMRTAVGQARLLMKERFGQFSGLVDDCDFKRGEKITTCTDLQGFWDMVFFQVEDVKRKFNALKEAEARDWKEVRPVVRKHVAKKPPAVRGKAAAGGGASAAAKTRLAAIKAAMRAKQAEQKSNDSSHNHLDASSSVSVAPTAVLPVETVVFHGGFFQVESPVKPSCPVRRSCRISSASSPAVSKFSTPVRQCRLAGVSNASPRPLSAVSTPIPSAAPLPQSPRAPQTSPDHSRTMHPSPDHQLCSNSQPQLDSIAQQTQPEHIATDQSDVPPHPSECSADVSRAELEDCVPELNPAPLENIASEGCVRLDVSSQCLFGEAEPQNTPAEGLTAASDHNDVDMVPCIGSPDSAGVDQDPEVSADLDFERYLRPSARASVAPEQSISAERFSLGAVDAEMESPVHQQEELPGGDLATPTPPSRMGFSSRISQMPMNLLLFTPEKESVRQSLSERDLMTFTPPASK